MASAKFNAVTFTRRTLLVSASAAACAPWGPDGSKPDMPPTDAGGRDAGFADASNLDASAPADAADAGAPADAASTDAAARDAGLSTDASDAGSPDAAQPTDASAGEPDAAATPDAARADDAGTTPAHLWSDPATWGGAVPGSGAAVVIEAGKTVTLDTATQQLTSLTVRGELLARDDVDVELTAGWILVDGDGAMRLGTSAAPRTRRATVTLTGARPSLTPRMVVDQVASSGAGNGKLTRLFAGMGAVEETLTVTWSGASTFSVVGSVSGSLGSGTAGAPFNNKVRFVAVAGSTPWAAGATRTLRSVPRGVQGASSNRRLMGRGTSVIEMHAAHTSVPRTRLNANAASGATTFTLADPVDWKAGDEIVVGPTAFFGQPSGRSQRFTLAADAVGNTITTVEPLSAARWGRLQYITDDGLSLTPGTFTPLMAGTPDQVDERAMVIHLSRLVVVQGADDADWATHGFGASVQVGGVGARGYFQGVEFRRVGQGGVQERYPLEWHMLSYATPDGLFLPSDGTYVGDSDGYARHCSVADSSQRMITLHGTCGITLEANVGHNITGHAVFLEDGSELRNTLRNNAVIRVKAPRAADVLVDSDVPVQNNYSEGGTSAYWLPNPGNTVQGNWAAESAGTGFWGPWISYGAFGLCADVDVVPIYTRSGPFERNVALANRGAGIAIAFGLADNLGVPTSPSSVFYNPQSQDRPGGEDARGFAPADNVCIKNTLGGYRNRTQRPEYLRFCNADNGNLAFFGSTLFGSGGNRGLRASVAWGATLNVAPYPQDEAVYPRAAFASYHTDLAPVGCVFGGFPDVAATQLFDAQKPGLAHGGAVRFDDVYLRPLEMGWARGSIKLIQSSPGRLSRIPQLDVGAGGTRKWHLAGAHFDAGLWGTPGNYVVQDHPFLTSGASNPVSVPGGISTPDRFYGVAPTTTSGRHSDLDPDLYAGGLLEWTVTRFDPGGSVLGTWEALPPPRSPYAFVHWAAKQGAEYVERHTISGPSRVWLTKTITNAYRAQDHFIYAVPFDGTVMAQAWLTSRSPGPGQPPVNPSAADLSAGYAQRLARASTLAELRSSAVPVMFQDAAQQLVWVHYWGGQAEEPNPFREPLSDDDLFRNHYLIIKEA
jgi:hypothetical protein